MNTEDLQAYQSHCFEYSQDHDIFESILTEDSQMAQNRIQQLFSCQGTLAPLLQMPYERFEMISAGSLDNSGDLFDDDKRSLSNNKLFSIESFFNGAQTGENTHEQVSSN